MQHSGPGFARVDPLRGRVSSSLQSEVRKTINTSARGVTSALSSPPKRGSSTFCEGDWPDEAGRYEPPGRGAAVTEGPGPQRGDPPPSPPR